MGNILWRTTNVAIPNIPTTSSAVLIGINYTGTNIQLEGCIDDVKNIYNILTTRLGYTPENICIMTDYSGEQSDKRPTRDNILRILNEYVAKTKPGDTLYVHYSGHGVQYPDKNRGEYLGGQDDCILPLSGGIIKDDELNEILVQKLAEGANLIVTMDACHSGSILHLPVRYTLKDLYDIDNKKELGLEDKKDIICLGGCRSSEGAADTYEDRQAQGAFTWGFTSVLKVMDKSQLYIMTWKDILLQVRTKLKEHKYTQEPQLTATSVVYLTSIFDM